MEKKVRGLNLYALLNLHNFIIQHSHYIPSVIGRNPISYSEPTEISESQTVQRTLYWKRRQMEGIMIHLFSHRPSVEA